jgi:hypothetical protein
VTSAPPARGEDEPPTPTWRGVRPHVRGSAGARPTSSTPPMLPRTPLTDDERRVARQAYAGLLWSKQFYHYIVRDWLEGDPATAAARPPRLGAATRLAAPVQPRRDLDARQVGVSVVRRVGPGVPHDPVRADRSPSSPRSSWSVPARVVHAPERADPGLRVRVRRRESAGPCLGLLARLQDDRPARRRDRIFLARCFQKLLLNFTWWVNRKDPTASTSSPAGSWGSTTSACSTAPSRCPTAAAGAGRRHRLDGVLLRHDALDRAGAGAGRPAYEDMASKFFEHFVAITDAMNTLGGTGLWDEEDGFYYDQLHVDGRTVPLQGPLARRPDPAARRRGPGRRVDRRCPGSASGWTGSWSTARTWPAHLVHAACWRTARAIAGACWPSRRASGWSACCATCWTRTSSSRPTASARLSRPPGPAVRLPRPTARSTAWTTSPGSRTPAVRRQLQLARAGLVSHQLPADRGAGALPSLLRRQPAVECPTGSAGR